MKRWQDIEGWFDDADLFQVAVDNAPAADPKDGKELIFIEVGSWLGRSTACLGQLVLKSRKKIRIVAVDTWEGSANEPELLRMVAQRGGRSGMLDGFLKNLQDAGVAHLVRPLILPSLNAVSRFLAGQAHFVYIDGDHTYEAVRADIAAWGPVVAPGGILAGHDFCTYADVQRAVREAFGSAFQVSGSSWWKKL